MKKISYFPMFSTLLVLAFALAAGIANAQSAVFNPDDPIVSYNASDPPTQPVSGPGKWVRTSRMTWSTTSFKCYIYKGIAFRLKYPKTYVPGDGKKYPLFLFFHGAGEKGTIYDNEYQLYHGGYKHGQAVDNGLFDGFLFYPQSTGSYFSSAEIATIVELIEQYFIPEIQVDPFRISVDGLSAGGRLTWNMMIVYPKLVAGIAPISNAEYSYIPYIKSNKFTPVWLFQGALDANPPISRTHVLRDSAAEFGANFTYTEFADRGHDCWYNAWAESDYYPFLARVYKSNPWPLNGRFEFCPQETISQVIGVCAGFDGYEWRKNGDLITGATTNTITATELGTYDCRIKRGTLWSDWSPIPVVLKTKGTSASPTPELATFSSKVLPAPDGSTQVQLTVPAGYSSYKWTKVGSTTSLSSVNTYTASAGSYQVTITESYGCESTPSAAFTVVNANGTNKPEAVRGLIASNLSKTSIKLNWITNANTTNPATNFEIYQATKTGGPYQFVGIVGADDRTFTKVELTPGVKYYYIVRPVNNTAAGPVSSEVSIATEVDSQPPTAPGDLQVTGTTRNSISLQWRESSDDVGVVAYDVYVNGVKSYSTTLTSFTVYNLEYNNNYSITVKARDLAGNESPASNQVSAKTLMKGLAFRYYVGEWDKLPDFNTLATQNTGFVSNVTLANKTQSEYFGFLWEGHIRITTGGSYTFRTNSDDGSRLYINAPYNYAATPLVDNDGTHSTQNREGTITLDAGVYPIAISYFNKTGASPSMALTWKTPSSGTSYVTIPDSVFVEAQSTSADIPSAPSNLVATALSYSKVSLSWSDNSNNETSFEIFRSTNPVSDFATVAVLPANTTTYQDTTLSAATQYYYKVRAINQNGESAYDRSGSGVSYAYYETVGGLTGVPGFSTMIPVKTGRVDNLSLGMQNRSDNFAVKYEGVINIPATGKYKFYNTSDDGAMLYLDNSLIIDNNGAHSSTTKESVVLDLTAGYHTIRLEYFENSGSEVLSVSFEKTDVTKISKQIVPATMLGQEFVSVTTLNAPPVPAAPTQLQATNVTSSTIKLAWVNNATDATKYQLYRSYGNNEEYVLYAEIPAANTYYTDTALFPNATVYYKVKAVSANSISEYSNELNVLTLGVAPTVDAIENQFMRFGTELKVYVNATTVTTDAITLQASNLPAFATFSTTGNGKGVITFTPSSGQKGTYSNIIIKASNPQDESTSRSFSLTVNDNYVPGITKTSRVVNVNENDTKQISFTAEDGDTGDALNWSFSGLPTFVTLSINNRTAQLNIAPITGNAGTYAVIAKVEDGKNGKDTMAFTIEVASTVISTLSVQLSPDAGYNAGGVWNSTGKILAQNEVFPSVTNPNGLKDQNSVITNVRFSINVNQTQSVANYSGMNTTTNSGVYPDKVLQAGYRFIYSNSYTIKFTGLDPLKKYSFTFFNSYNATATTDLSTKYTIGTASVSVNAAANTQNVGTLSDITPGSDSIVLVNMARGTGNSSMYYYLNAIVISDAPAAALTSAPGRVKDLTAKFENNVVNLAWTNTSTNATAYEIYRSGYLSGQYTLLNSGANNGTAQTYIDSTIQGNKNYFYFVRAKNSYGGTNSATVKVAIPNKAPVIVTSEVFVKTQQAMDVSVTATDDATDVITLSASGLPSFATFTDNGNGTGTLHLNPLAGNIGVFKTTITATDNYGASAEGVVRINVTDKNITSIYVNFNQTVTVDGIWNSFNKAPSANASISNLKNDIGATTTASVTLAQAWTAGATGAITGDNSGRIRDEVLQTFYSDATGSSKTIKISGLSTNSSVRYNLVFMSSITAFDDRTTVYTIGSKTVSLNAANNTQNTVQINDITPTNGVIEYTVSKTSGSLGAYINALIIQEYTTSATLLAPDNIKAVGIAKDSIKLIWNNRVDNGDVELYRSTSANGTYNLIATVSGNSSYTDFGLEKNTEYFYKLRAKSGANYSPFSYVVSASTYAYSVYINFNRDYPAGLPWNNTNGDPIVASVFNYFLNDNNNYSGISMIVGEGFSGLNGSGVNTGNNSGVVPDNVMRSSWWVDAGQESAQLQFTGLSQSMRYSFKFFASRAGSDWRVSVFSINGRQIQLKVADNRYQTVTLDNIIPDENGEVLVKISGSGSSGYIGGLIISPYKIPSDPIDGAGGETFRTSGSNILSESNGSAESDKNLIAKSKLEIYPNPFVDDVMIKLSLANNASKLVIKITDLSGRVVVSKQFSNVSKGNWQQAAGLNNNNLLPGIYLVQVLGINGEVLPPIKILKTR
ncbi:MAG: PA14 domain-containing protein [Agriterribacter sp.]